MSLIEVSFCNNTFRKNDDINGIEKPQKIRSRAVSKQVDRPFFAFDVYNSQYSIIFLDDEKEDPDVFLLSPFLAKGGKVSLISPCLIPVFSDLVNEAIRRVKNNLPM